ncbi:MAG: carbohydrate-binding domain-containing protein [Firmicutes bacterium]|nr:carbohydrate-binding domain-containing protein [Bacillota bacterium]
MSEGQVIVKAADSDDVTLVFSGVDISSSSAAPVQVISGDNVIIEIAEDTANTVSDNRSSISDSEEYDAAVWSACDLDITGSGSLTVTSKAANGVKTKDDLGISGVTLSVNAAGNALKGNDSVTVESGTLSLSSSGGAGIKTSNAEVSSKGNQKGSIVISGGIVDISAAEDGIHAEYNVEISKDCVIKISTEDDAVHAEQQIIISGGTVNIDGSHEGLEANVIDISGGEVYVAASDDGLNATAGSSTPLINISGGYIEVETSAGDTDAVDSNGNFTMSGGVVIIKAGSSNGGMAGSVDVDGSVKVTGGTIIAFGGISSTPSGDSVNTFIQSAANFSAGSYVLADASGTAIASFELGGNYSSVWIASDQIKLNGTYSLSMGGSEILSWTQSSQTVGSAGASGGMNAGRKGR